MEGKNKSNKPLTLQKEYWFLPAAITFAAIMGISGIRFCFVIGSSMLPTYKNGNMLCMQTKFKEINRYDIIVFSKPDTKTLIKRVIGLPGEKVQIIDNDIYINDEKIEDAVNIEMEDYGLLKNGIVLAEDEYFAMGDNRNNSYDCRKAGPAKLSEIKGKILGASVPKSVLTEENK